MNNFYVYALLDPRYPGKYQYSWCPFSFLYKPYYIGKGHGNRINEHFNRPSPSVLKNPRFNKMKQNTTKKIKETGLDPIGIKLYNNLEEETAFDLECFFICAIGRKIFNQGPLTNMTAGGEGAYGIKRSPETCKKLSKLNSGTNNPNYGKVPSEETRKKISDKCSGENAYWLGKKKSQESVEAQRQKISGSNNPNYGKPRSEETKQKISLAQKGKARKPLSDETKRKLSEHFKGRSYTPEQIEKYRLSKLGDKNPMRNRQMPEEERRRRSESAKKARDRQRQEKLLEVAL